MNSTIEGITITDGVSAYGGGLMAYESIIKRSRITANTATIFGGGIYAQQNVTLIDSEVSDNVANLGGGGIYEWQQNSYYDLKLINSTISGNEVQSASGHGGGLFVYLYNGPYPDSQSGLITNSTISGNSAAHGGGIYSGSGYYAATSGFVKLQ